MKIQRSNPLKGASGVFMLDLTLAAIIRAKGSRRRHPNLLKVWRATGCVWPGLLASSRPAGRALRRRQLKPNP